MPRHHTNVTTRLLRALRARSIPYFHRSESNFTSRVVTERGRHILVYATGEMSPAISPVPIEDPNWQACWARWHAEALRDAAAARHYRNFAQARENLRLARSYRSAARA